MTSRISASSWCRSALVILSLFMLTSCTTAQQRPLSGADKPVCDMQKGLCAFSWKIFLVSEPEMPGTDGQLFASGRSVYPVNKFTDIPFEINHGDQNKFAVFLTQALLARRRSHLSPCLA